MRDFNALIRDTLPIKNPAGTWHWAKNIIKKGTSIVNEDGLKFQYLIEGTVIGFIATNFHVVYFHKNNEGIDEIGIVNTNNDIPIYKTVVKTNLLNFQYNCPIEGIFVYNYKNELIVSWCDGVYKNSNQPRVLNTVTLPFEVNPDGTLVNDNEFYNINLTPNKQQGNLDIDYLSNGNLGGYSAYVTHSYILNDDSNVGFFETDDVAYICTKTNPTLFQGLRLEFTDLDPLYNRLRIGLVINQQDPNSETDTPILIGYQSEILLYEGTSFSIDITDLNLFEEIAAEEIIIGNTVFTKVNTMTKQDNQAHLGNVETTSSLDFQKFANLINLIPIEYIPQRKDNVFTDNQEASFPADEVISFYIQLQYLDGTYSNAFHIPGRVAEGTERDVITESQKTNFNLDWTDDFPDIKQFHIFNKGFADYGREDNNLGDYDESDNKFGYWENKELYPDNLHYNSTVDYEGNTLIGADLRNTPIRYHRFPSVRSMHNNVPDVNFNNDTRIIITGLPKRSNPNIFKTETARKFAVKITNIEEVMALVPASIRNQIQGYRLCHVKRTTSNSYVAGNWVGIRRHDYSDPMDAGGDGSGDSDGAYDYYNFGFNNAGLADPQFNFNKLRLIGNELFKFKPSIQPVYIQTNYKFLLAPYTDANLSTAFNSVDDGYVVPDVFRFAKCSSPLKYTPENSTVNHTDYHENGVDLNLATIGGSYLGINLIDTFPSGTPWAYIADNPYMTRVVLNLTAYVHKLDVYSGFKSNDLNIIGRTNGFVNDVIFKGGDIFTETVCNINVRGVHRVFDFFEGGGGYVRRWHCSLPIQFTGLQSPINCSELFNDVPVDRTITDVTLLGDHDYLLEVIDKRGASRLHDLYTIFTFDVNDDYITKFPYRIYRGLKIANESLSQKSLAIYPVNSYYEMPNDKGEIIALRGRNKSMFIQMRFSLFIANIKDTLKTDDIDAYLGKGDLFDRSPNEVLGDDKGYIGSVSKFASTVVKGVYITVNQVTGQIFLVADVASEISDKGTKVWFWNNWDIGLGYFYVGDNEEKRRIDNPFISVGHLVGYDKQYNRLLFIKKDYKFLRKDLLGENVEEGTINFDGEFYSENGIKLSFDNTEYFINKSRTFSFSLEPQNLGWIAEHDYFPNLLYYTSNGLYSALNNLPTLLNTGVASLYKHNDKLTKGLYYGNKFNSYIDLIFNQNLEITKLLQSITWVTDVINNNGGTEKFKTISHIMVYSDHQCSGIINLKDNHFTLTRNANSEWNFNDFRDMVINPNNPIIDERGDLIQSNINQLKLWFDKSNFISKFITVRLIMDNVDNNTVYLHEVRTKSIISKR